MNANRESELIRALKVQMTTVNGYAQMLEREISENGESGSKQRQYAEKLRQSVARLQRIVDNHDNPRPGEERCESGSGQEPTLPRAPESSLA